MFGFLGFHKTIVCKTGKRKEFDLAMLEIENKASRANNSGGKKKLLLFVYAAGHGEMPAHCRTTNFVFNEAFLTRRYMNLEALLYNISNLYKNVYIIAVHDCCRLFSENDVRLIEPDNHPLV